MISREELRQLASFESRRPDELAISFYFEPSTPQDKSHREEGILAKDLVRRTIQELQVSGRFRSGIADLERILDLAERCLACGRVGDIELNASARAGYSILLYSIDRPDVQQAVARSAASHP